MKVIVHLTTCWCKPEAVPVSDFIFILVAGKELMLMPASAMGFISKILNFIILMAFLVQRFSISVHMKAQICRIPPCTIAFAFSAGKGPQVYICKHINVPCYPLKQ